MLIKTQLHQPSNKSCVAKMSKNDFSIVVGGNSSCKFSFKIHTQFSFPRSERAALLLLQVFCLWLTNWVIRAMPAVLWCDCECVEKSQWLKFSLSLSSITINFSYHDTARKLLKRQICDVGVLFERVNIFFRVATALLSLSFAASSTHWSLCSCDDDDYLTDSWDIFMPCYL